MPSQDEQYGCIVEYILGMIDGKWKPIILYHLFQGTQRFNQLHRAISSISRQVLTTQLRELETDGLISRKVYPVVPPKVEYSITNFGKQFEPILEQLANIGETLQRQD